jgi:hypothetical protein
VLTNIKAKEWVVILTRKNGVSVWNGATLWLT